MKHLFYDNKRIFLVYNGIYLCVYISVIIIIIIINQRLSMKTLAKLSTGKDE